MDTTGATAAAGGGAAAFSGSGISAEEEQARMAAMVEKLQARDALRMYTWLSQRCFSDCVSTFYRKTLGKGEGACVRACVRKYLLVTTASAARFAQLADPYAAVADDEDDDQD
ncbi:mitochondrial import inner membrane translocase subunit Tim9-like [Lolium rigidum]|uniref:mitochondrial import inner membrane translocase subunit Tim9-like n=1 Tax=Lolium rigidum TaxID=89674 RepID=UPI001F5DAA56|nr:mitochondrial import inner membrane translocase subunit Tim9-like [Lolium rigidum]